jgi:hypothetical protein
VQPHRLVVACSNTKIFQQTEIQVSFIECKGKMW